MNSQYTLIHIEIVLNVHTSILQYIFSVWGNKMSSEKNSHHFCFWHPPSFDFYIVVILSPGVNDFFLPDRLKKKSIQLASSQTTSQVTDSQSQRKAWFSHPKSSQRQAICINHSFRSGNW